MSATFPDGIDPADYPGVSPFTDRHGKPRWRFRKKGRGGQQTNLPGKPGEPEFEIAYQAAVQGISRPASRVTRLPTAALPKTFGAAARELEKTTRWKNYDPATRAKNTKLLELFLESPIVEGETPTWRAAPIPETRRAYLKEYLTRFDATPAKRKHMLVAIRKLITVAFDMEWIEIDPTTRLDEPVSYVGWKAWTPEAMARFEARWPIGSAARTCYGLALWLGNRRGDVASLSWKHQVTRVVLVDGEPQTIEGFEFIQNKNRNRRRKKLFVPITPMLAEILAPLDRNTETILVNGYGKSFSAKSLTGMMAHWNSLAKNPAGFTIHGLRKTLGDMLATGEATTRQMMDVLGHDDMEHTELYSRSAEQARLAHAGMTKVVKLVTGR